MNRPSGEKDGPGVVLVAVRSEVGGVRAAHPLQEEVRVPAVLALVDEGRAVGGERREALGAALVGELGEVEARRRRRFAVRASLARSQPAPSASDDGRRPHPEREAPAAGPPRRRRLRHRAGERAAGERLEIEGEVVGRAVALLGVLLQAVADDALEDRRDGAAGDLQIRRIVAQDGAHRVGGGAALEGALAGEHLVEDGAEREDVRAVVGGQAAHLLRGHVADRAEHDAGVGRRAPGRRCGEQRLACPGG